MGLLKLLSRSIFGLKGITPNKTLGSNSSSKLHNTYSINGLPEIPSQPSPSGLDLNGKTPNQYINNLPE